MIQRFEQRGLKLRIAIAIVHDFNRQNSIAVRIVADNRATLQGQGDRSAVGRRQCGRQASLWNADKAQHAVGLACQVGTVVAAQREQAGQAAGYRGRHLTQAKSGVVGVAVCRLAATDVGTIVAFGLIELNRQRSLCSRVCRHRQRRPVIIKGEHRGHIGVRVHGVLVRRYTVEHRHRGD